MFPDTPENETEPKDVQTEIKRPSFLKRLLIVIVVAVGVGFGAWKYTQDAKTAFMLAVAIVVSGVMLGLRALRLKKEMRATSPLRMVLNIIVAIAVLAIVLYFYTRGMDNLLEP